MKKVYKYISAGMIFVSLLLVFTLSVNAYMYVPSNMSVLVEDFRTNVYDYQENIYGSMTPENGYSTKIRRAVNGFTFLQSTSYLGDFLSDKGSAVGDVTVYIDNFAVVDDYEDIISDKVYLRWYFYLASDENSSLSITDVRLTDDFDISSDAPVVIYKGINDPVPGLVGATMYEATCELNRGDFDEGAANLELTVICTVSGDLTDVYLYYGVSEQVWYSFDPFVDPLAPPPSDSMDSIDDILADQEEFLDQLDKIDKNVNVLDLSTIFKKFIFVDYIKKFIPLNYQNNYIINRIVALAPLALSIAFCGYILHGKRG